VFGRAMGWPGSPRAAVEALAGALERGASRRVVLGRVRAGSVDRVFVVNAGVGLDAETVHMVESRPALKQRLRQADFVASAALASVRAASSPNPLTVEVDGGAAVRLRTLSAACGAPYAYLGPRRLDLLPGADFDGAIEWIGLRRLRLHEIAAVLLRALDGARHLGHPAVAHGWAEREIVVRAERPEALQADGEPLGRHREVRIAPGPALQVLLPGPATPAVRPARPRSA
jgi:diacylglycerol kinase family enzyme